MLERVLSTLSSLRASEWIAVYGALLSTTLAVAQGVRALQRRRGVKVRLQRMRLGTLRRRDWEDVARISVINRRDYALRAVSFALEPRALMRRKRGWFLGSLPPCDIRAHDRVDQTISIERLKAAGVPLSRRLRAIVGLTTDETFRSCGVVLDPDAPGGPESPHQPE